MKAYFISPVLGGLSGEVVSIMASHHFHGTAQRLGIKHPLAIERFEDSDSAHHPYHLRRNNFYQPSVIMTMGAGLFVKPKFFDFPAGCGVKLFPVVNDYIYNIEYEDMVGYPIPLDDDIFDAIPNLGWARLNDDSPDMQYFEVQCRVISPRTMGEINLQSFKIAHAGRSQRNYFWSNELARDRFIYWSGGYITDSLTVSQLGFMRYSKYFYITEMELEG